MPGAAVGIDLGGTKLLGVLAGLRADGSVEIMDRRSVPSEPAPEPGGSSRPGSLPVVVEQICELVDELCEVAGSDHLPVGLGVAGYVEHRGVVVRSPNVVAIEGLDLGEVVGRRTGAVVVVANDANCVAVAAHRWRRPHVSDLVVVTLGTGIGGGLVVDDRLVRGANGFAGEPGHMVVEPGGIPCPCGQQGCWERYASGTALAALAAPHGATPEQIVGRARAGDEVASAIIGEFSGWLAMGVANLVNLLDPALVVLGGGLGDAFDVMSSHVVGRLVANPTIAHRVPPVEVAPFGASSGAVGAAALAAGWDLRR